MTDNPNPVQGPVIQPAPAPGLSRAQRQLVAEIVDWTMRENARGVWRISRETLVAEFTGGAVTEDHVVEAWLVIHAAAETLR